MAWFAFDEAFGQHDRPPSCETNAFDGRAARSETHVRPDEVVERWVENPYWPYFCGFDFFQHRLPIDSGTMTRWRKRVGSAGMEQVLSATVGVAVDGQGQQLRADYGGVQPRAIAHPTDSRLYLKALQALRPNGTALSCAAATPVWPDTPAGRYAHARQFRRMRREIRKLKTFPGRIFRDIVRKIAGNAGLEARFAKLLGLASSDATARGQEQALCPARSGSRLHRQR